MTAFWDRTLVQMQQRKQPRVVVGTGGTAYGHHHYVSGFAGSGPVFGFPATGADKGTGVIFLTVGAIVAILGPNDDPKNDSRTLIRLNNIGR